MPRSDGGGSDRTVGKPLVSGKVRPGEEVGTQTEVTQTPSALSGGAAPSGPSGGFLTLAKIEAARVARVLGRWTLIFKAFRKIRKYQRYFHNTGERLKDFPKELRDGIKEVYPKQ